MALFDDASLVTTPNGYKAGTLYSIKPTSGAGDMDVVRATTATRVNSAGLIESVANNVPRLDYSNGTCPSLLVEPQRSNIVLYSEQFDNAYWTTSASITANTVNSPDGTQNADTVVFASNNQLYNGTTRTSDNYSLSVFVKKGNNRYFSIQLETGVFAYQAIYDLDTTTVTNTTANTTASITDFGGGWFRVTVMNTTAALIIFTTFQAASSGTSITSGAGTFYLWGAQLELGSYPTSYIPTTTASVTRNADEISKTGISSLIGQTEGAVFADFYINGFQSPYGSAITVNDGVANNYVWLTIFSNGNLRGEVWNGSVQASITYSGAVVGGRYKMAFGYKTNDFVLYVNGTQVGTDTSGTTFSGTTLSRIDNDLAGIAPNQVSQSTNQIAIFPTRLTNAELATLTTI